MEDNEVARDELGKQACLVGSKAAALAWGLLIPSAAFQTTAMYGLAHRVPGAMLRC